MKLLSWFRGNPKRGVLPPAPPPLSLLTADVQSESGMLPVVGTSHYQPALQELMGRYAGRQVLVTVACEFDNAHDPNAIVVKDDQNRTLGYLPHNIAASLCKHLAMAGNPIVCPAEIQGGGDADQPSIGLTVDGAVLRDRVAARHPGTPG